MADQKLTPKQKAFVQEYIIDFNATQAAIRAGYSKKTAAQAASRLLRNVKIQAAIKEAIETRAERVEVSQDYVLNMLLLNTERAMQVRPHMDKSGEPTGEFIYQGNVANKSLELLGKHLGMFKEKIDVNLTNLDYSELSDRQPKRLREGEDPEKVLRGD